MLPLLPFGYREGGKSWSFHLRGGKSWSFHLRGGKSWSFRLRRGKSWSFRLLWNPSGPDEICEKQDDHESAPSLELLKEAGQYVTEYKNLKTGQQS
jgi:hypothetical protein